MFSRLNLVLNKLVDHSQGLFVKGRNILHDVHMNAKKSENLMVEKSTPFLSINKVDIAKAYDFIDCGFLNLLLFDLVLQKHIHLAIN